MLDLYKQVLAEEDLIDIWGYSFEQWGAEQADLYLDRLDEGFQGLRENPYIGVAVDHIRQGYRRYRVQHHMVYYRVTTERIEIVRVLHEGMEPERHL